MKKIPTRKNDLVQLQAHWRARTPAALEKVAASDDANSGLDEPVNDALPMFFSNDDSPKDPVADTMSHTIDDFFLMILLMSLSQTLHCAQLATSLLMTLVLQRLALKRFLIFPSHFFMTKIMETKKSFENSSYLEKHSSSTRALLADFQCGLLHRNQIGCQ